MVKFPKRRRVARESLEFLETVKPIRYADPARKRHKKNERPVGVPAALAWGMEGT